jgi:hypothetical protein
MKSIPQYHFSNEKYGKTLLVDIVPISEINKYIAIQPIHRLTFYDLTFVTKGNFSLAPLPYISAVSKKSTPKLMALCKVLIDSDLLKEL